MGNHIFIIDSVAIGEYISGLIDKKFKSSSEFCNKWLEENNEPTDKSIRPKQEKQAVTDKKREKEHSDRRSTRILKAARRVIRANTQRGRVGSRTAETGIKLLHSTV